MRAFQVIEYGNPAEVRDVEIPQPKAGEVQVQISACGLNFADTLLVKGQYQEKPPLPATLGLELAGTVTALGEGVTEPAVGTRVAVFAGNGGLAEYGCFPANRCIALPDQMPFDHAAAFLVAYGTSEVALTHRAKLREGETLLVLGAAGGVGLTAVELGNLMGAKVIAVARGPEKLKAAQAAGAHHLIDSESEDIRERVKELGGADVVYDPVGGDQFKAAFRACNPEARVIVIGFASGDIPQIPANHLLVKNISVLGFYWGGYKAFRPEVITDSLKRLMGWYAEGKISPHISHNLPLERAGEGLDLLTSRKSTGKVVITI
ncbi:MAG: NADPH:quinone oxidoreductase family protein [Rhodobacteraceae bacterium]|nr:NADPH:quinone oxidoreductase family protein [Paracoccaceae bacterium]